MIVTVVALIILVQVVQVLGDWLAKRADKRDRHRSLCVKPVGNVLPCAANDFRGFLPVDNDTSGRNTR